VPALDRAIVDYLAGLRSPAVEHVWNEWCVRPVASGNNRLYRVTHGAGDWAAKFTIRDERERARREFSARRLGLALSLPKTPLTWR
jgi:hypothetical protein